MVRKRREKRKEPRSKPPTSHYADDIMAFMKDRALPDLHAFPGNSLYYGKTGYREAWKLFYNHLLQNLKELRFFSPLKSPGHALCHIKQKIHST